MRLKASVHRSVDPTPPESRSAACDLCEKSQGRFGLQGLCGFFP